MKILLVHNVYQQRGGEDTVVAAETQQLEVHGHTVLHYSRHNDELLDQGLWRTVAAGVEAVWATRAYHELEQVLAAERPEIVHFHNTLPLVSPSAYYACARAGVPVVQTLHNYRLVCPGATFLRDGRVCEDCLGHKVPWRAVVHGCYRKNRPATAAVTVMLATHHALQTWQTKVDGYIALSEFARKKFTQGGLPEERLFVKPNFVHPDPGMRPQQTPGKYALFVGRLSEEKGLRGLLAAWKRLAQPIPLFILGDGPMREELNATIADLGLPDVTVLPSVPRAEVFDWMRGARFLTCPSHWFEGCPLVVLEAFACGVPVIATGHGPIAETIEHGRTGLHVSPADDEDLAEKVEWALSHPDEMEAMSQAARREFEAKYTAQQNYARLKEIYQKLIEQNGKGLPVAAWAASSLSRERGTEC